MPREPGRRRARQHARASDWGCASLGFTQVFATFPEPFELADAFGFLPGQELLVHPAAAPDKPDLAISFDAASVGRLGELAPALPPPRPGS